MIKYKFTKSSTEHANIFIQCQYLYSLLKLKREKILIVLQYSNNFVNDLLCMFIIYYIDIMLKLCSTI